MINIEEERAAFELWALNLYYLNRLDNDFDLETPWADYQDVATGDAWAGWLAAKGIYRFNT